jgi:hypothetical protein
MQLRTNEDTDDTSDLEQLYATLDYDGIVQQFDFDQALDAWATEAILNQSDGYWAGSLNFYLYHHPQRGWIVLPWDLDNAWDYWSARVDPLRRQDYFGVSPHLDVVLAHPEGRQRFVDAVKANFARHDLGATLSRIDDWSTQIRPELEREPHRAFTLDAHDDAVEQLREIAEARYDFLADWVASH